MLDDVIQRSPIKHLDSKKYFFISMVKIYWIARCTTTGFYFPPFSSLLNKREEEKKNELAKPVLTLIVPKYSATLFMQGWGHI